MKDNKRKTVGSKNSFRRGQDYKPVVVHAIKKAGGVGGGEENSSERCKKTRSSWNDFSNRRNPPRSHIMWISRSTFLEREELRRDPFPLSRGQNENTGVPSPRYLVMASHYLYGQQPRESVLVTTVVFLERKVPSSRPCIYIYILLLFPNKSTRERKHTGWREERGLRYFQERFLERKTEEITAKHEKEDTERERERRGIIIKMREISKRSWIYVGTKMVSPGIKGSPYIRIVVTEVSTCRRIFICISISARPPLRPWESQVQFYLSASIVRSHRPNTFGYLYFITRVFLYQTRSQDPLFPRREQYARFAAGNTLIFYPRRGANASFSFSPLKYRKHSMLLLSRGGGGEESFFFSPSPRFSLLPTISAQTKREWCGTRIERSVHERTNVRSRKFTYT